MCKVKILISMLIIVNHLYCSNSKKHNSHFNIIIEKAQSYKYDFKKEVFTTFFIDRSPIETKFHLAVEEKNKIANKYYNLSLNRLSHHTVIKGCCMTLPNIYTKLYISETSDSKKIEIIAGCKKFGFFEKGKAERINSFLEYIDIIMKSKSELQNIRKSNIKYL